MPRLHVCMPPGTIGLTESCEIYETRHLGFGLRRYRLKNCFVLGLYPKVRYFPGFI